MRIIAGKWRGRNIRWPKGGTTRPMPDRVRESVFNILGSAYGTPGQLPPLVVADLFAGSGSIGLEALSRGAAFCLFVEHDAGAAETLRRNLHDLGVGPEGSLLAANAWLAPLAGVARHITGHAASRPHPALSPGERDRDEREAHAKSSTWREKNGGTECCLTQRPDASHFDSKDGGTECRPTQRPDALHFDSKEGGTECRPTVHGRGSETQVGRAYDLIFLDPPYASARDTTPTGPVPKLLERLAAYAASAPPPHIAPPPAPSLFAPPEPLASLTFPVRLVLHHERRIVYPRSHWAGWSLEDRRDYGTHAVSFYVR